jgi:hypothetical protein
MFVGPLLAGLGVVVVLHLFKLTIRINKVDKSFLIAGPLLLDRCASKPDQPMGYLRISYSVVCQDYKS